MDTAQKVTTKYEREDKALFEYTFIPIPNSESALREVFYRLNTVNADTEVFYTLENSLYDTVLSVSEVIDLLSTVLLVIWLIFMVFVALLLLNFITISIGRKKKEIGILRAIGARGVDIFKIFFCESGVIVGICLILSVVGTPISAAVLNNVLKA